MTDREFFIQTLDDELPRFERVYKALPPDKLDWRPHENSRNAGDIVNTTILDALSFMPFLETGKVDFIKLLDRVTKGIEEESKTFISEMTKVKNFVSQMTEEDWGSTAEMLAGEKVEWSTTKRNMAWGLILDLIHHRGQLSVYIRPMGGKVPSIYGPSADTQ